MSAKSLLPRLLAIRASIIVGGVKSAAPVVNVVAAVPGGLTRLTPYTLRISLLAVGVNVSV